MIKFFTNIKKVFEEKNSDPLTLDKADSTSTSNLLWIAVPLVIIAIVSAILIPVITNFSNGVGECIEGGSLYNGDGTSCAKIIGDK